MVHSSTNPSWYFHTPNHHPIIPNGIVMMMIPININKHPIINIIPQSWDDDPRMKNDWGIIIPSSQAASPRPCAAGCRGPCCGRPRLGSPGPAPRPASVELRGPVFRGKNRENPTSSWGKTWKMWDFHGFSEFWSRESSGFCMIFEIVSPVNMEGRTWFEQ